LVFAKVMDAAIDVNAAASGALYEANAGQPAPLDVDQ